MTTLEEIEELHEQRWREADERARRILYGEKAPEKSETEGTVFVDIKTQSEVEKKEVRTVTVPGEAPHSVFAPPPEKEFEEIGQQARTERLRPKGRQSQPETEPDETPYQKYQNWKSSRGKGFTPEARAEFNARMKAQGIVTMTPEGEIDAPKRPGSKRSGAFRRS